jgi:TRAP-type C4-dicarboxylate transport system permease small subunit
MSGHSKAIRVLNSLAVALGWFGNTAGSVMLAFMTLLITVDVLGRYLFGSPTFIATEVSGYLMAAMVFLGLARISRTGQQIEVTILLDRMPDKPRKWVRFSTLTVSLIFIAWFAVLTIGPVRQNLDFGSRSITPLKMPMWIPTLFIPIGLGLLSVDLLARWLIQLENIMVRGAPYPDEPAGRES